MLVRSVLYGAVHDPQDVGEDALEELLKGRGRFAECHACLVVLDLDSNLKVFHDATSFSCTTSIPESRENVNLFILMSGSLLGIIYSIVVVLSRLNF